MTGLEDTVQPLHRDSTGWWRRHVWQAKSRHREADRDMHAKQTTEIWKHTRLLCKQQTSGSIHAWHASRGHLEAYMYGMQAEDIWKHICMTCKQRTSGSIHVWHAHRGHRKAYSQKHSNDDSNLHQRLWRHRRSERVLLSCSKLPKLAHRSSAQCEKYQEGRR